MTGFLHAAFVIGRRDFVATVYSRAFLFFLLGPLVVIAMGAIFGNVSQRATQDGIRATIAVIADPGEFALLHGARIRLSNAMSDRSLPDFVHVPPSGDPVAQVSALLASREKKLVAVLSGGLDAPVLTGSVGEEGTVRRHVALVVREAREARALAEAGVFLPTDDLKVERVRSSAGGVATMRALTARIGQMLLFILTVLLSGMLLSNLLEEKSNKVIEVLAAAVPVDAIFVGKIFSMLAVSIVGILVWGSAALLTLLLWKGVGLVLPEPAVGWPGFVLLAVLYYSANYLLLGALFLGIGSQASTVREVQILSMPVTVGQMLIFILSSFAVGSFGSPIGIAAAVFPFSSPLAMVARAAEMPELWPHLLALCWQALWVWLIVRLGATLFRRNVLRSGPAPARSARRAHPEPITH